MGLFDFLRRKPAPPPKPPFPATISACEGQEGTLRLADGGSLRFSFSACQDFAPTEGLGVTVLATTPHPVDGLRALMIARDPDRPAPGVTLRPASPAPTPAAPPAPIALPELEAPPAPGMGRVLVLRFENPRPPDVFIRELTLDGRTVRVLSARAKQATPLAVEHVFDKHAEKYGTPAQARAAFEVLAATATKDFKQQTRTVLERPLPARPGLAPAASNPDLEALLDRASEAEAAATAGVLADWLQTQGDPRGELAALFQHGGEAAALAFLEAHGEALLGDLDAALGGEIRELSWRHGFLSAASLRRRNFEARTVLADLTRDFLALPLARFVTRLRFGLASYESDNSWTDTLRAAVESARGPHLRELRFDDYTSEDCELSWTAFGDFSPFWARLPALEFLHLRSGEGGTLGEIDLPNLKTFIRESGGLSAAEIGSIVRAKWPRLERLDVWFGSENYGGEGSVELIRPLLDADGLPRLRHLGLVNSEFTPDLLGALLGSKVLPQLEVLDLSKGVLRDADVEVLVQAEGVRHLKRLDLSENLLNESQARLLAALPSVVVADQRFDETDGDEEYRYSAVGE